MRLIIIVTGLICLLAAPAIGQPYPEASEEVRAQAVKVTLKAQPKTVLVYAKGLCCPSCAIGIRKMLSRLDFVDTSGENQGIELDPKTQLVTMRLRKGHKYDARKVSQAIDDAGYAPVSLFRLSKGKVVREDITVQNPLLAD